MTRVSRSATFLLVAAAIVAPTAADACTVCMGDTDTNTARAANAAIFLMLGVLAGMFSLLGSFGYYLYKRSNAPTPPHAEFGDLIAGGAESNTN